MRPTLAGALTLAHERFLARTREPEARLSRNCTNDLCRGPHEPARNRSAECEANPSCAERDSRADRPAARPNPGCPPPNRCETNPSPPSARGLEQLAADQHPPGLAGARPDLVELGVPEQAARGNVVDVAVAAQRPDRLQRHPGRLLGGEHQAAGFPVAFRDAPESSSCTAFSCPIALAGSKITGLPDRAARIATAHLRSRLDIASGR